MYLLLSGEGPGDIGICNPSGDACDRTALAEGPMTIIIDQLIEQFLSYEMSHLDTDRVSYVSESFLAGSRQRPAKKAMALKGKKRPAETKYYFENARALAVAAKAKAEAVADHVIAVLFRDSDGTASASRGDWESKRNSMLQGFASEGYEFGVPMIPKPKLEAWLLCAFRPDPYQHCTVLESASGNDRGQNPLKAQLNAALSGQSSTADLNHRLRERRIDVSRIDMPSFDAFRQSLQHVVQRAVRDPV